MEAHFFPNGKEVGRAEVPFLSTILLPPLQMYAATRRLKKKLCCSVPRVEAQMWPFLTALALGSYTTGLRHLGSACTEKMELQRLSTLYKH